MYLTTGTTASTQATQGENRRAMCDVSQSKAVAMFVDSQEKVMLSPRFANCSNKAEQQNVWDVLFNIRAGPKS